MLQSMGSQRVGHDLVTEQGQQQQPHFMDEAIYTQSNALYAEIVINGGAGFKSRLGPLSLS